MWYLARVTELVVRLVSGKVKPVFDVVRHGFWMESAEHLSERTKGGLRGRSPSSTEKEYRGAWTQNGKILGHNGHNRKIGEIPPQ